MRHLLAAGLASALLLSTAACGTDSGSAESVPDDTVTMPAFSEDLADENYEDVLDDLREAGFTNVETEALGDLITGWLTKEGSVEAVEVDGDSEYSTEDRYPKDVEVVVAYHSFPADEEETPEPSVSAEEPASSPEPSASPEPIKETLTVKNNEALAALLAGSEGDYKRIKQFATTYAGETIEFDGNIAYMNPHGSNKTRYDILIYAGDYSETSSIGPNFQFRDVNVFDLHLTGKVPDGIGMGDNLHIVARVGEFSPNTGLFLLEPVSTRVR